MKKLFLLCACLLLAIPCQAEIITVDDDGPADFNNIQAAIDDVVDGDTVIVAPGTYTGNGNRDIDFGGKAITVRSTDPNNPNIVAITVIDCNGIKDESHRGFLFLSGEGANSVLEGFTIMNGWASVGAGINCNSASPTIRHCLITGNTSRHHGGGIYCRFSSPVITNCTLRDNTAIHGHGGAIFCFSGSPDISTCIISDNSAGSSGGGFFNNNCSSVLLMCNFSNNSAKDYGGGVCNTNNSISVMTDCTFADNRADYCGDDSYSEGEPCPDLNNKELDAKIHSITSSGRLNHERQMSGSSGTTYYVNGLCGNNSWSGLDSYCMGPDGPKQTIQAAIDDAENSDAIIVFPHIYLENITIEANDISLTSIDPNDPNIVKATVIDGRGGNSVVTFAGIEGHNCLLAGFTIINGYGNGGGINCNSASPTIANCVITGNSSGDDGGGVMCSGGNPLFSNCSISNNSTYDEGAGIYCGGGAPVFENCKITSNFGVGICRGGGMWCRGSNPTIICCNISGNSSINGSGGLGLYFSTNATIINSIITNNTSNYSCGGIKCYSQSDTIITNCVVSRNNPDGIFATNSVECLITNSIVSDNVGTDLSASSYYGYGPSILTVSYSNISNGETGVYVEDGSTLNWGNGNIDTDPCFVDPNGPDDNPNTWEDNNYRLLSDSLCIDAGDPNYVLELNETDLDGKPRIIGGRIDMGAYEYGQLILAESRILPRTINLASKGKWITCYIWLPEEYNITDIDPNSVFLKSEIQAEFVLVDEEKQIAMARFSRQGVQAVLEVGDIDLKITGRFDDAAYFEASDTIKVIDKGLH